MKRLIFYNVLNNDGKMLVHVDGCVFPIPTPIPVSICFKINPDYDVIEADGSITNGVVYAHTIIEGRKISLTEFDRIARIVKSLRITKYSFY